MRIILSEEAGFCPGVRAADKKVRAFIETAKPCGHVYILGKLIHNRIYNEGLERAGVITLNFCDVLPRLRALREGERMFLVTRTHGTPKQEYDELRQYECDFPALKIIDATCPYVSKIHRIAEENTGDDTCFLLFSTPGHPEAVATMSYARGLKYAFSSEEELLSLDFQGKKPILCAQTTQNSYEFEKIKKILEKLYTNAIFFDTICNVTGKKQKEAIDIARHADAMIVIGGRESSNTAKLAELCSSVCPRVFRIESATELITDFPGDAKCVGITAGASTPDAIIMEVVKTMEDFSTMLEGSIKTLHTGDTVTGTVYTIDDNEIKLDLGAKFTGVLTKEQITDDPSAKLSDMFKIGDEVEVFVIRVEDGKGLATVSKTRVDRDNSWVIFKDAFDNATVLEGKVTTVVKSNKDGVATQAGVLLSVAGSTVFVPASQTGYSKGQDLTPLVGTVQRFKVIEFNDQKKRALGSIKVVANEEKRAREDAVWATLEVGQHFRGTVKNLTSYGAFVDIGGVDGMVHNSELSWKRIKHPSQVVAVGQVIDVYIKDLDREAHRISLGYKTPEMDSWVQFVEKYHVGDVVPVKVVSILPFGAFADVNDGVDGLIHISRISTERIASPADVLSVGQVVDAKIIEIDNDNRKVSLSIRAIKEDAERAERAAQHAEEEAAAKAAADEASAKEAEERAEMAKYIVGELDS